MPIRKQTSIELYKEKRPLYERFTDELHSLLEKLLKTEKINFHLIDRRTKTIESFSEKISRENKQYSNPIDEITDFTGIRIIVYYNDDVEKVINLLKSEFPVDYENSNLDNNNLLVNEFGYLSKHIIVEFNKVRLSMRENSVYSGLKAEIQVRTVLQHSWSSLSHALQYKSKSSVPFELQRQLFRLAGLFELADEEFISIRNRHYSLSNSNLERNIDQLLLANIDILSIKRYVEESDTVNDYYNAAISIGFADIDDLDDDQEEAKSFDGNEFLIRLCEFLNIKIIDSLDAILKDSVAKAKVIFSAIFTNRLGKWYINKSYVIQYVLIYKYHLLLDESVLSDIGYDINLAKEIIGNIRKNK